MNSNQDLDQKTQQLIDECGWAGVLFAIKSACSYSGDLNDIIDTNLQEIFGINFKGLIIEYGFLAIVESFKRNLNDRTPKITAISILLDRIKEDENLANFDCGCRHELAQDADSVIPGHVLKQTE